MLPIILSLIVGALVGTLVTYILQEQKVKKKNKIVLEAKRKGDEFQKKYQEVMEQTLPFIEQKHQEAIRNKETEFEQYFQRQAESYVAEIQSQYESHINEIKEQHQEEIAALKQQHENALFEYNRAQESLRSQLFAQQARQSRSDNINISTEDSTFLIREPYSVSENDVSEESTSEFDSDNESTEDYVTTNEATETIDAYVEEDIEEKFSTPFDSIVEDSAQEMQTIDVDFINPFEATSLQSDSRDYGFEPVVNADALDSFDVDESPEYDLNNTNSYQWQFTGTVRDDSEFSDLVRRESPIELPSYNEQRFNDTPEIPLDAEDISDFTDNDPSSNNEIAQLFPIKETIIQSESEIAAEIDELEEFIESVDSLPESLESSSAQDESDFNDMFGEESATSSPALVSSEMGEDESDFDDMFGEELDTTSAAVISPVTGEDESDFDDMFGEELDTTSAAVISPVTGEDESDFDDMFGETVNNENVVADTSNGQSNVQLIKEDLEFDPSVAAEIAELEGLIDTEVVEDEFDEIFSGINTTIQEEILQAQESKDEPVDKLDEPVDKSQEWQDFDQLFGEDENEEKSY